MKSRFKTITKAMLPLTAVAALCLAGSAQAAIVTYTTMLSGAAESPPNLSSASGMATVIVDDVARTMRVLALFTGLGGTSTAAHIHCCTAAALTGTAGVATVTPTFTGFPAGVTSGTYDFTYDMNLAGSWNAAYITANGGTTSTAFTSLKSGLDSGTAYFNLHTTSFGGGEIRGFLTAVPEPGTWALVLLAGVAAAGSRRRKAL